MKPNFQYANLINWVKGKARLIMGFSPKGLKIRRSFLLQKHIITYTILHLLTIQYDIQSGAIIFLTILEKIIHRVLISSCDPDALI